MSFKGVSPKKMAKDISEGYVNVTAANLRKYQPADLRQLLNALNITLREIRGVVVPEGDFDAIKKKNFRMQNINRTIMVINHFVKHRRIQM